MTPQSIETLLADIEAEDPIDFGALCFDEHDARRLMANHFCDLDRRLAEHGLEIEERLEVMAAIAAHTMTENMVLHVARLRAAGDDGAFRDWMRRHGLS